MANLPSVEWRFQLDRRAKRLGISSPDLRAAVLDIVKAKEKKASAALAEERRAEKKQKADDKEKKVAEAEKAKTDEKQESEQREMKRKAAEKVAAFVKIQKSPTAEHETKLVQLAKRLDADIDELREEFTDYVADMASSRSEPWPEPVDSAAMLAATMAQWCRYMVASDEGTVATVLWTAQAWTHDIATHSPILVLTSIVPGCGKTTGLGVLEQMTPRAYSGVELTGPNLFHIVDNLSPTLIIDEADQLFSRRPDLAHLINQSWTRGAKVPRLVRGVWHDFNIFCPKVIGTLGLNVAPQTATRFIVVKLFPKLPEEKVEDFRYVDDEDFVMLRRKQMRWSIDHAAKLKDAKPEMPVGFDNRLGQNWRLMFAIAKSAGGKWQSWREPPPRQCRASVRLKRLKPSGCCRQCDCWPLTSPSFPRQSCVSS